jgi:cbb3-type cytochrome oxidase subunit 3
VRKSADRAQEAGFLLKDDAERLVREAAASKVLR